MARGDGSIYKRGGAFWIKYYAPDPATGRKRAYRERGGSTEAEARGLLKKRNRQKAVHEEGLARFQGPQRERVTLDMLLDALLDDYRIRGLSSLRQMESRLGNVRRHFGAERAVNITTQRLREFVAERKGRGARPATINRELEGIRRAFRLAVDDGVLFQIPNVPQLPQKNARKGFFGHAEFFGVLKRLGDDDLADFLEWFYRTGMRPKSIAALSWPDLDVRARELRVHAGDDKAGRGIVLPLTGEWWAVIERRIERRRLDCRFIFHRNGRPVGTFYKRWRRACGEAGVSGRIPYDLRRTAARNMIRAGVPEGVVMAITGWTTRAMLDRYNISSPSDKIEAQRLLSEYLKEQAVEPKVKRIKKRRLENAG